MTMIYFQNTTDYYVEGPSAVTLGKFDGVHLGHQKLVHSILEQEKQGLRSVLFALNNRSEGRILTPDEQRDVVEELGVSTMVDCPFVPEIYRMSPKEFADQVLVGRLHAGYLAVGVDFRFGHHRAGDAAFLQAYGKEHGIHVDVFPKVKWQDREISSTYVREALEEGNMKLAAALLGRPFYVSGKVLHGQALGRRLGMPTANLIPPGEKILPPYGVYFTRVMKRNQNDGPKVWNGVSNVGCKPTVDGSFRGVETYLFDDKPQLYGEHLRVELLHFVRPELKFDSIGLLKEQIRRDISAGREYFRE